MICFEVFRNGEKLCTAGVGDYGVLNAIVTWVGHHPDKLARWAKEGVTDNDPTELSLNVGGIVGDNDESTEHAKWLEQLELAVGDNVTFRVIETLQADGPWRLRRDDPAKDLERQKEYVREMAKGFGWEIRE